APLRPNTVSRELTVVVVIASLRYRLFQTVTLFSQSIETPPEGPVNQNNGENQSQRGCQQQRIIAFCGGFRNERASSGCGVRLAAKFHVFSHDACVPGAAARGDGSSDNVREERGQDQSPPAVQRGEAQQVGGIT